MPYKNIHFVKVKMELLKDHRFLFQLNDRQKGLYIMLLALAGKTNNQIFNDLTFIKGRLALKDIEISDLEKISEIFPKFFLDGDFWRFKNFNEEHNQILGISKGYPKDTQRMAQNKNRIEENRKEKSNKGAFAPPTQEECVSYFEKDLKATKDQAIRFYQFYGSKDWFVGKNRMKNWHLAAARSLEWASSSAVVKNDKIKKLMDDRNWQPKPFLKDA